MTRIIISSNSLQEIKTASNTLLSLDPLMKLIRLPNKLKKFTVIRSPHVTNRSREQFQICTHKWVIKTNLPTPLVQRFIDTSDLHIMSPSVTVSCIQK